jgi:1-acyl-sn-glycerol-3-phosphate acyltransferase
MGLTKFLFYDIMGWKIVGRFDPSVKKTVVIVAPHTSWYDFFIGLFSRKILKTQINWLGKKELFIWPLSYYFKWTGGTPLDRTSGQNKVEAISTIFSNHTEFRLAMAPEGTRKKVDAWRTGFYYIAEMASVPITPVSFDYATKTVNIGNPYTVTGSIESDLPEIQKFFKGVVGKIPANF